MLAPISTRSPATTGGDRHGGQFSSAAAVLVYSGRLDQALIARLGQCRILAQIRAKIG
jgi:hypothetical protein